jgi:hypothetical protein
MRHGRLRRRSGYSGRARSEGEKKKGGCVQKNVLSNSSSMHPVEWRMENTRGGGERERRVSNKVGAPKIGREKKTGTERGGNLFLEIPLHEYVGRVCHRRTGGRERRGRGGRCREHRMQVVEEKNQN